jgi:hypothetical protein
MMRQRLPAPESITGDQHDEGELLYLPNNEDLVRWIEYSVSIIREDELNAICICVKPSRRSPLNSQHRYILAMNCMEPRNLIVYISSADLGR